MAMDHIELSTIEQRAIDKTKPIFSAGVEFIDENGGGPGVRLRKRQQNKG